MPPESEACVPDAPDAITWDVAIPLVTNPRMVRTIAMVSVLSALIPALLLGVVFAAQGEWNQILTLAGIFAAVGVGLFAAFLVIMALVFGNRYEARFTVSARGITQETLDRVGKTGSRLAVILGVLGRSPSTAGAGMLAMTRESESLAWRGAFTMSAHPRSHLLVFGNAWRPLMEVYCTPENYPAVEALARRYMSAHQTAERGAAPSPLPRYVFRSALVLLAAWPVLAAHEEFDIDILAPMVAVAFMLATVWLVPLFGYVVLACNAWIVLTMLAAAVETYPSFIRPGVTYRAYEVYADADWFLLAAACLGLGYWSWLSIRSVRGRTESMLMADADDMGV